MGRKTPPYERYQKWTQARFWSFVRSNIRLMQRKWPPANEVWEEHRRVKPEGATGRHRFEYQCAECSGWFPKKVGKKSMIQLDHKIPCGSCRSFKEAGEFIDKMLVGVEGFQLLCTECHQSKTNEQRVSNEDTTN